MSRSVAEQSAIFPPHHAAALIKARRFGVPRSMIDAATARRSVGDWRGACRAAGFDVRLDLDDVQHRYGRDVAHELLDDLRHLAPDLLRWHLPRNVHESGRLRPGSLIPLARYSAVPGGSSLMLSAFTAPAALAAGERVLLVALPTTPAGRSTTRTAFGHNCGIGLTGSLRFRQAHRYRLDQHSFTWDARQSPLLRDLCAGSGSAAITRLQDRGALEEAWAAAGITFRTGIEGALRPDRAAARGRRRAASAPVNLPSLLSEARRVCPGADQVALPLGAERAIVLTGAIGTSVSARCVDTAAAAPSATAWLRSAGRWTTPTAGPDAGPPRSAGRW